MFCHDRYSLLFVSEKKQHDCINTREETMGQKEGGERAGHCLHNDRICGCPGRGKDDIHLPMVWWMGNGSSAFAGVPCLTPLCRALLHISRAPSNACVLPIRRLALAKPEDRRAGIMRLSHSRRRTAERSCLMRDTR